MNSPWLLDGIAFVLLCAGFRFGQPKLLRALCSLAILYLIVFGIGDFFWLKWQFHNFQSHPNMMHEGITNAFIFQGFWNLFANMLLVGGVMPLACAFLVYFLIKWVASPLKATLFS